MTISPAINETNSHDNLQKDSDSASIIKSLRHLIIAPFKFLLKHVFTIILAIVLYYGWQYRDDNYLSAETGTGYLLGIVGGSLMIILLLYPLSKRVAVLTRWIPIRYWFGTHMLFGIVGPVMVLFHSNFHLGSTNSSIALISMLLVAGSGLVGRYIYTHIHHGLYGAKITLAELKQETESNHAELLRIYSTDEELNKQLKVMEEKALQAYKGLMTSLLNVVYMAVNARKVRKKVLRLLKDGYSEAQSENSAGKIKTDSTIALQAISRYMLALRKAAAFSVYERLFSWWHILHLPLFIMMIITATVHIFAVHMY